jgi:type IV pilus modification protein PilV
MKQQRTFKYPGFYKGFTLLEIMISVLIISVGLVALANLQTKLSRYSATAKQRTLAVNLAEQQIETMQAISVLGSTGAGSCATEPGAFDDLAACTSGVTVDSGSGAFTMTWTISQYLQNADGTTEAYVAAPNLRRPDLKLVTIKVAWVDGRGVQQDIELSDIVDATSIFNSGRIHARIESNAPPMTVFNPAEFPGVVAIAIGEEKLKGSTTPEPTIQNKGNNVITSFDVVTYLQSGAQAYLERREEFKVLNCVCQLNAGLGTGREPTVWDGEKYVLGANVSKRTGQVSTLESGQPAACQICCNDHHDGPVADTSYDPYRPDFAGETGGFDFLGDHAHYNIVDGLKVLATEGDAYLEACRFIRKDGFFVLASDLSLQNLDVVPAAYPTNLNAQYSTSVIDFVTDFVTEVDPQIYAGTLPDPIYTSLAPGIFLGNVGVIKPAMSRGIYVDFMTHELLKKIKCLQAGDTGPYEDYCDPQIDPPWQEILPFFDLDVTALANWSKGSPAILVSNSPISDVDSASFSRGAVQLSQEHYDIATDATASIEQSNSGLTDTNPVDAHDELENSDDIPVTVVIGGNPPADGFQVQGNIMAGSNQINVETVRVQQDPPLQTCEIISIQSGNTTQKGYVCDLTIVNGTASGSVTFSDYNALKITGSGSTVLNRKVCPGQTGYASILVIDDNTVADPDLGIAGERTVVSYSGLVEDTTLDITIVEESKACP